MRIRFTRGERADRVEVERHDGSRLTAEVPHKGPFPHDATHAVVERAFGLRTAFWGRVAAGASFDDVAALARAGGHASAKRAADPDPAIIELLQAERLVECFEADLWSGGSELASFRAAYEAGCAQSRIPPLALDDARIESVRANLRALLDVWRSLPVGATLDLDAP